MRFDYGGQDGSQRLRIGAMFAAGIAALLGAIYLYVFDPASSGMFPTCPFHTITGFHCPGCGTLRALHQLLHGNFQAAFFLNPLTILLLPPIVYGLMVQGCILIGIKPLPTVFIPAFWIWTLLAVILAYWVLRNIPLYPFSLFAPF